ncbi:MAG: helix-turn-helix transcriptional regulator [Lachnospiraceae bacterium]|nr:helix-turn-helix transcriptional regulator [Lachnospiraceae bacterium]
MIVYDKLWETMKDRGITKYTLVAKYGLSPSLITRLKRNQSISIHTVNTLCSILHCRVEDIMEYIEDEA